MRLLHVVAAMDPKQGGVSQAIRSMITGLGNQHISNEVVSLDAPDQQFLKDKSLPAIHALGPGKGPWCFSSNLTPWLSDNLSRFDGIIIHGLWLYPGYAVKKALLLYGKQANLSMGAKLHQPKLFVMPHGMLDPYFQHAPGRKMKAFRNRLYWKYIESKIISTSDKILFTSEDECTLAAGTFSPYQPKMEVVVGLGVDDPPAYTVTLKDAFAQKCPAINASPYLLFLGRIHEKKGLDLLISAYASFLNNQSLSDTDMGGMVLPKLIIAGPGTETLYGKKIQEMVLSSSMLSKNIIFAGMLTGDAKWGAFYGSDAFILPSYQENFGIAVVEAMACKKPVLISNRVNIWREIEATESGIISNPTLEGVKELLKSWIELSNEGKSLMGENARKLFQDAFAVEAAAKRLTVAIQ